MESMDGNAEQGGEPVATLSNEAGPPDSIRITRHGKLRVWIVKALHFLENHPDKPLVLYSAPADVSTSTMARLVSVVEIIKREYLKGRDVGLHQYNQLLSEQRDSIPIEAGEDRSDALSRVLDGHSHAKQCFAPHMKITLSTKAIVSSESRETYQAPGVRRMSRSAKTRMRKRQRKQGE